MNWNRSIRTTAAAFALAGLTAPAFAQQSAQPSEARIQELIRLAAERVSAQAGQNAPLAQAAARPTIQLSLDDAIKAALEHNLDIQVQRLNPEISDIAIATARAAYNPTIGSNFNQQSTTTASTSTTSGGTSAGAPVVAGQSVFNANITQSVPWFGGNFVAQLQNNRQTTTSLNSLYNPQYNANWSYTYTQPVLRNFRIDATRQGLMVARINRDISDIQLRASLTNTLSNVRNAYWDYVFAVQSVEVNRQSVALAEQLVANNQTKVEVGTMAPIEVVQAQSQAALQRQNLVAAQATMRTAEIALKRLVVNGTQDPLWNANIDPIDRPDFVPEVVDVEAAVRRAIAQRTDVEIIRKNLTANDITVRYLNDQTLPQADVTALYGVTGVGGTAFITSGGNGVNRVVTGTVPGGYGDALGQLFDRRNPRWQFGFAFTYPLGLTSQKAAVARSRVQLAQIDAQLKQMELQVATEVTNAATGVMSNIERVQAAGVAQTLAQRQLDAEKSKFDVGMSTNYFVVQTQRDLATSQNNYLSAVLAYRRSVVELERLQQTALQNANITIIGR